jgi:DnaJ-class molecular chaperone
MEFKDYYKIMGVARDATQDEIKRAYRQLARKYHPDVSKEPDAEARFKEVGEAYEALKDPEKRAAYDQLGANWKAARISVRRLTGTKASSFPAAASRGATRPVTATFLNPCSDVVSVPAMRDAQAVDSTRMAKTAMPGC